MKKKVLFFLYSLSGGGAERTVINIINNLDRNKFKIVLVLGTDRNSDYIELIADDVDVEVINASKLKFSLLKLRNCINKVKPDLLFSTINQNNIILLMAKLFTFKKIPTIIREANNRTQSGSVSKVNKFITFLLYNFCANKIIALSKGVEDDLVTNFKINKNKIDVIYNPVEINSIKEMSNEVIEDFKKKENEKLIIAVGRLVEQKDFTTLIKAFDIVSRSINTRLLILGKGPLESKLKDLSKNLGVDDRVFFMGFKKNPYKYMKEADIFVLSSKWEGFGHVIVEAMATGTPVISTDCNSGPAEIIDDNKFGILVPVGNYHALSEKVIEVLKNEKSREKYSLLGYERAKDFNAKNIVSAYQQLFLKFLQ